MDAHRQHLLPGPMDAAGDWAGSLASGGGWDWAGSLPSEVLALVFSKLPSKGDRLAFLAACRSWRVGCGAAVSSLALPWPILDSSSSASQSALRGEQTWSTGVKAGSAKRSSSSNNSNNKHTSNNTRSSNSSQARGPSPARALGRPPGTRSSSLLSVRWLGCALRLFRGLTALELSVPVPPDALGPVARLPGLRRLALTLRPPPFSTAEGPEGPGPAPAHTAAPAGTPTLAHAQAHLHPHEQGHAPAAEEKYEAAFLGLLSQCPQLQHLSLGMRACRWEPWPLLPAPLLSQLARSLPSLESLHLLSPLFASHSLAPLLPLQHLSSLTLPLDLPQQQPANPTPSAAASLPQSPDSSPFTVPPLPRLQQLLLQPYDQPIRGGAPSSWHTQRWRGGDSSHELPSVVSALTSLRSLRVAGYARSPLQRAEFVSNALCALGPDLSPLRRLTHVQLCFLRELEALPPALCSLPALASLALRECPCLLHLPEEIGQLAGSLRQLELHSLGLHSLPASLCQLSSLSSLALGHLHWLQRLPQDLGAGTLPALESLSIVACKRLGDLPAGTALLPRLGALSLLFNLLPLPPPLLPGLGLSLRSLALSLRCQADLEAVGPALGQLPLLQELHLVLSDDTPALAIAGSAITAVLPCSAPGLLQLKIEDLRSVSHAGAVFPLEGLLGGHGAGVGDEDADAADPNDVAQRDADVAEDHADVAGREGCRLARTRLLHFAHGPYPLLPGLRQLQVKCAWLHYSAACFPELQELDLVLLLPCPPLDLRKQRQRQAGGAPCRGEADQEWHRDGGSRAGTGHWGMSGVLEHAHARGHGLASLVAEVLSCPKLRALSLFTPDAPNALTMTPAQGFMGPFQQVLFGGPLHVAPPVGLTSFLLNGMDMMPCFV